MIVVHTGKHFLVGIISEWVFLTVLSRLCIALSIVFHFYYFLEITSIFFIIILPSIPIHFLCFHCLIEALGWRSWRCWEIHNWWGAMKAIRREDQIIHVALFLNLLSAVKKSVKVVCTEIDSQTHYLILHLCFSITFFPCSYSINEIPKKIWWVLCNLNCSLFLVHDFSLLSCHGIYLSFSKFYLLGYNSVHQRWTFCSHCYESPINPFHTKLGHFQTPGIVTFSLQRPKRYNNNAVTAVG